MKVTMWLQGLVHNRHCSVCLGFLVLLLQESQLPGCENTQQPGETHMGRS